MGFFLIGQTSFFIVIKQVEATRASSLLGLKLLVPALISVVIGRPLSSLRWPALVLCTADAVGMNFPASCLPASAIQEVTLRWALKKLPLPPQRNPQRCEPRPLSRAGTKSLCRRRCLRVCRSVREQSLFF